MFPIAVEPQPTEEGEQRDPQHDRHEHRADAVDDALDRRLLRLRVLDQADDARQRRFGADRGGAQDQTAFGIDRAAGHAIADLFGHRQRFAADQRFVGMAAALEHVAVHGKTFAGQHDHAIADPDLFDRKFDLAVAALYARRGRTQRLESADGFGGLVAGAGFEPFSHQDQGDDHRRRFEIEHRLAMVRPREQQVVHA